MHKVGYVRISNPKKQDAASQIRLMQEQGIAMENIFVDMESGGVVATSRISFKKMMWKVETGSITEIVFSEYSRIGRDFIESLGVLIDIMRSHKNVKMRSLASNEKDINDYPVDMQFIIIMFSLGAAQREREHIKERTKWGMDNVKANGSKSGKPIGRPKVVIDFEAVKKLVDEKSLREAQAIRVLGYNARTFYKAKKERTVI
jgi:DNA invertase Pin-like site-specific DNA recombinase